MKNTILAGLLLATLVACTTTDSSDQSAFTTDQGNDFGNGYLNETERAVSSISLDDVITAASLPGLSANSVRTFEVGSPRLPKGCRSLSAGQVRDDDDNGVPEDVAFEFDANKCNQNVPGGNRSLSGRVRIRDNGEGKPGYAEEFSLEFTSNINGQLIQEKREGSANLTQNGNTLVKSTNLTVERKVNGRNVLTYKNTISYTFVGSNLKLNQPLPAGTVTVTGKSEWLEGQRTRRNYHIRTPSPLQYDPNCSASRLVGGSQVLEQSDSTLRVTYNACGGTPSIKLDEPNLRR